MKITPQVLSLPPYISTTWQHIAALHVRQEEDTSILVIDFINGNRIEISRLEPAIVEQIFSAHLAYNENSISIEPTTHTAEKSDLANLFNLRLPAKFFSEGIDKIAGVLQHNPEAADTADLPQELLDKVATMVQSLNIEDSTSIPQPVEDCNCLFCQIARTMQMQLALSNEKGELEPVTEEEVSDEDLQFKTWDIHQTGEQLYEVVNPLDSNEQYHVFLGEPLGCTCGCSHCEHICAVLKT